MVRPLAAIAAVLAGCACATPARAGRVDYAIDFSALVADGGSVITGHFDAGPFTVYLNGAYVYGPGTPGFSGKVGITLGSPATSTLAIVDTSLDPMTGYDYYGASATFAATPRGDLIQWTGTAGLDPQDETYLTFGGAAPATIDVPSNPSPIAAYSIFLDSGGTNDAQLTGLVISADLHIASTLPEPPGWLLGAVGMAGAGLMAGRRRVIPRSGAIRSRSR